LSAWAGCAPAPMAGPRCYESGYIRRCGVAVWGELS